MNFKRIGRILVCFLLVCCLIVNVSPIKAHATAAAIIPVVVPVSAPLVIGAVLIGLGISYGAANGAFDGLIETCTTALTNLGDVVNGKINVYVHDGRSYVDPSIIRNVRGHLFSSSVLTESLDKNSSVSGGTSFSSIFKGECTINADCYAFYYQYSGLSSLDLILIPYDRTSRSASGLLSLGDGSDASLGYVNVPGLGSTYFVSVSSYAVLPLNTVHNLSDASDAICSFYAGDFTFSPKTVVSTEQDLSLGVVAPSSKLFEEAYSVWGDLSLNTQNDSDEDMPAVIYPIEIPESEFGFSSITQEDVWEGGAIAVPGTGSGTGTGTGSGTISGSVTLPGWVQDGFNNLLQGLKDIFNTLLSLPAALWAALPAWLTEGITNMVTGLRDILDAIKVLPGAIAEAMADVITGALTKAFAISDTFVATKVEALTLKYPYLDTFFALGADLKAFFLGLGTTPPVIYINLGASEGSYNIGGQEVFMDLSWYARYKPTMDAVIGGFIWLWLAWRIYLSIPGIISGASGVWGSITRHSERSMKNNSKENAE